MRLGYELVGPAVEEARAAEDAGFDLLWLGTTAAVEWALALAGAVRSIAFAVVVDPSDSVTELARLGDALGRRLVTCLRPGPGADDFAGTVDRFLAGHAPPGVEPVVWVAGGGDSGAAKAVAVATSHGLAYVADDPADGAETWPRIDAALGKRALRLRRPARWPVPGSADDLDVHGLAGELSAAERAWGLDTAILGTSARSPDDRTALIWRIAHDVRPRVQLDRLPPGLSDYWDGRMAARLAMSTRTTGGDDG
jgi:hypothetical protein